MFDQTPPLFIKHQTFTGMKQVTFSESQWALLRRIIIDARVHEWNQWHAWKESESGILLAGMNPEDYERALSCRLARYQEVDSLFMFLETNAVDLEEVLG